MNLNDRLRAVGGVGFGLAEGGLGAFVRGSGRRLSPYRPRTYRRKASYDALNPFN
jgi:hypothetical protein